MLDYADEEFTRETRESITLARRLYFSALSLLDRIPTVNPEPDNDKFKDICKNIKYNLYIEKLQLRGTTNLDKLQSGLNIAGLKRIVRPNTSDILLTEDGLKLQSNAENISSSQYRYSTLIERSKQLINLSQQIENNFLNFLEKRDQRRI
ncbi:MAG: hypothetical protein R3E95_10305 [Thiolinea sp.]